MKLTKAAIVFSAILAVTSCLSGPFASQEMDAAAKAFTPPDTQANVYVVRDSAWPGYQCQVLIDGTLAGFVGPRSFQLVAVAPGQHSASCTIFDHTAHAAFFAEVGKNYFFEVVASPAWNTPKVELKESEEAHGKALVTNSRRAVSIID